MSKAWRRIPKISKGFQFRNVRTTKVEKSIDLAQRAQEYASWDNKLTNPPTSTAAPNITILLLWEDRFSCPKHEGDAEVKRMYLDKFSELPTTEIEPKVTKSFPHAHLPR